ncbi:MAG: hypothetical protein R3Y07_02365 [Eubacteriales bacterium]
MKKITKLALVLAIMSIMMTSAFATSPESDFLFSEGTITKYVGPGGTVVIPSSIGGVDVLKLGDESFANNTSITSVAIPGTIREVGHNVFVGSDSLTSVYFASNATWLQWSGNYPSVVYSPYYGFSTLPNVTVYSTHSTWAEKYCQYNGIKFVTVTEVPSWATSTEPVPTYTYASWAENNVNYAFDNNLVVDSVGNDFTVNINREQIADLLVNMIEQYSGTTLPAASVDTFSDSQSTSVLKAYEAGIISGKTTYLFDPLSTAKRQEIAVMIYRAIETLEEITGNSYIDFSLTTLSDFADLDQTEEWAKKYLAVLVNNGIMSGSGTGSEKKINANNPTSIQECFVLNNNLFKFEK